MTQRKNKARGKAAGFPIGAKVVAVGVLAIVGLGLIFYFASPNTSPPSGQSASNGLAGKYPFQVGQPGPGGQAPEIELPSTDGSTFRLSSLRGQTVLLYFQEGIMCQPCWDQLKNIEADFGPFKALGITRIVSITTDPLDQLKQKAALERLSTPVLSDPTLKVSETYTTNQYGMMGKNYNGHSFIIVGPDGRILWRADYGGAPKYIMNVPVPNLLADMRAGLKGGSK